MGASGEDQMVAFVMHNGPAWTGINANVFGLRNASNTSQVLLCSDTGREGGDDCFVTRAMCNAPAIKGKSIDHSVTVVGFGHDKRRGPFWEIKNSWSLAFGTHGFVKVARGIGCAGLGSAVMNTYGDVDEYKCPHGC